MAESRRYEINKVFCATAMQYCHAQLPDARYSHSTLTEIFLTNSVEKKIPELN